MRWLLISSALCVVLCADADHNGITNTTDSPGSTLHTEPWLNTTTSITTTTTAASTITTVSADDSNNASARGRALNLTQADSSNNSNNLSNASKPLALDDLSLDDVPMLVMHTHDTSTLATTQQINATTARPGCVDTDGKTYGPGEKLYRGCKEACECSSAGKIVCRPRCELPFLRKGEGRKDPLCEEVPAQDDCCILLRCTNQAEAEPLEGCVHKNQTFQKGVMFNDGCEALCSCGDSGKVTCKSRCPQVANNSSDQCVSVPDPNDPCCTVVFCDVTLADHDVNKISTEETTLDGLRLKSADALNSSSAIIHFLGEPELESNLTVEVSEDQMKWNKTKLDGVIIHNLQPGKTYYIRVVSGGMVSNAVVITLPKDTPETMNITSSVPPSTTKNVSNMTSTEPTSTETALQESCHFKGTNYTIGQEFNDACVSYCICTETGVECQAIECPSEFGLDVLDPNCVKWETKPKDFVPTPPNCCPDKVRCLDNGSCKYMGQVFPNWAELPSTLTGCEKKCYCELGNVTCQDMCPPVPATPPANLPCLPQQAMLHHLPGDDCCLFWVCPQIDHPETNSTSRPTSTPKPTDGQRDPDKTPYLGPYNPDVHRTNGKHPHHNVLAPFGLDEAGNPTEPPLPGPVVLPFEKDTSVIPGPPYLTDQHHKTYGFKSSKDEGIHGPPPFVIKPTKEDFDKKHKYPGVSHPAKTKPKTKPSGKPNLPADIDDIDEDNEDYDDANDGGHFQDIPHFHAHPHLHPGQPQVIYVNHPGDLAHLPPHANKIFQQNAQSTGKPHKQKPNDLDLAHPGPDGPVHIYHLPHDPHKHPHQDRRPLPTGVYEGDEEAVLHYHTQDLPDDPRIIAKEILAHLHNSQNAVVDQVFGGHRDSNASSGNFPLHHVTLNHTGFNNAQLPPSFPGHPNVGHAPQNGVHVQVLEAIDEHTVRLAFSVPQILVGLHGRVEVYYTATKHEQDPKTWDLQVLAPPGDLIATPQLHFDLGNLLSDTTYSIMIKIILRDLSNTPQSSILTVRTLPDSSPVTTLPPQIPVESGLAAAEVNSTWARLMWRKFTDFELQFIDGVQLRYREQDGKVFSATPLIHRLVTSYTIEDLKPNTSYEMDLFFIPFPGQTTELQSERNIHVTTALENDPYKFEINLEILTIKSTAVEVTWSGVPYPEDKYVNIYRVIYQSETGKEDFNSFKVAKRDSTPKITIMDLKPTTRYRLWLEAYLTNGRTKKSNVQDFVSKPGGIVAAGPTLQGKLSGTPPTMEPGDYYGPLVAVAILAALAIMAALILLLVLMRKHGQNKAAITSTRKTQSAYDNPSYKTCENDPSATGAVNGNGVSRERTAEENV